ncbi:hypothetical protein GCM10023088_78430 [Actinomadura verrucosospora]|uniref:helix-turn-helix domain-containing protein n=1 Tax=Actinomadura verrucosospora TaxID=46165 RepID=UPI0031EDC333
MTPGSKEIGRRLRAAREAPPRWSRAEMARRLRTAADPDERARLPHVASLADQIKQWEAGKWAPSARYRELYVRATGRTWDELFGADTDAQPAPPAGDAHPLPLLLTPPSAGAESSRPLTVTGVEALLGRLYRLDDEFGGNELCQVIEGQVTAAFRLFNEAALRIQTERRLLTAVAGLTQMAGWLSIDATRHADASRYLSATVYAAHETDDLGLASHAMGYMSLHAFYRDQPQRARTLADAALSLARAEASPRTRAALHNRAARAHARLGEVNPCRRQLDLARAEYACDQTRAEPQWTTYVSPAEIAAQRGACLLDLALQRMLSPAEAVAALTEAVHLAETTTPDHARDIAHYKTRLATAHLLQDEPEQAARVAGEAHDLATRIGSARIDERFAELVARMQPYDVPEVRALVDRVTTR